jgi:hypothetical protein
MKELSIERMEMVNGGKCPWWTSSLVRTHFFVAATIAGGPAGIIIGVGGLLATATVDYACSN